MKTSRIIIFTGAPTVSDCNEEYGGDNEENGLPNLTQKLDKRKRKFEWRETVFRFPFKRKLDQIDQELDTKGTNTQKTQTERYCSEESLLSESESLFLEYDIHEKQLSHITELESAAENESCWLPFKHTKIKSKNGPGIQIGRREVTIVLDSDNFEDLRYLNCKKVKDKPLSMQQEFETIEEESQMLLVRNGVIQKDKCVPRRSIQEHSDNFSKSYHDQLGNIPDHIDISRCKTYATFQSQSRQTDPHTEAHQCSDSGCTSVSFLSDALSNPGRKTNILSVVLQVNTTREIHAHNGLNKGQVIRVSSVLLGDNSKTYVKLTLWRDCSEWANRLNIGDTIFVTGVVMQRWKDEVSLANTTGSNIYNFHQPKLPFPDEWSQVICLQLLEKSLCMFQEKFYYLFNNSECLDKRRDITRIVLFCELQPGMVANVIGCNRGVNISSGSNEKYNFRGSSLPTITVQLYDQRNNCISLFIWGQQSKFLPTLRKNVEEWFEFKFIVVRASSFGSGLALHTTSETMINLTKSDEHSQLSTGNYGGKTVSSIDSIMKDPDGSVFTIRGILTCLQLTTGSKQEICLTRKILDSLESSCNAVSIESLRRNLIETVYTACGTCFDELRAESNGFCSPCQYCLNCNPDYDFTAVVAIRSFTIFVEDTSSSALKVKVFPKTAKCVFRASLFQRYVNFCKSSPKSDSMFCQELKNLVGCLFRQSEKEKLLLKIEVKRDSDCLADDNSIVQRKIFVLKDIEECENLPSS